MSDLDDLADQNELILKSLGSFSLTNIDGNTSENYSGTDNEDRFDHVFNNETLPNNQRRSISSISDGGSSARSSRHSGTISIEPYRMRIAEDFDGGDANVLSVKEGEIVWVLLDIDPQWCTVAHDENFGFLPFAVLEPIVDSGTSVSRTSVIARYPTYPPQDVLLEGYALFDFVARDSSELSLKEGDSVVRVLAVSDSYTDANWTYVELRDGSDVGWVPREYLRFVSAVVINTGFLDSNSNPSRNSRLKEIDSLRALSPVDEANSNFKTAKVSTVKVVMFVKDYNAEGREDHISVTAGEIGQYLGRQGDYCRIKLFVRIGEGLVPSAIVVENNVRAIEASTENSNGHNDIRDDRVKSGPGLSKSKSKMSSFRKTFRLNSPLSQNSKNSNGFNRDRRGSKSELSTGIEVMDLPESLEKPAGDGFFKNMRKLKKGRPNSTGSAFDSSARDRVNSRGKNAQTISDPALNHALDTASDMAGQEAGLSLKEMLQSVTRSNSRARRNTHDLYKNKKAQEQPRESAGSAIEPPPQQAPSIPKAKHPRKMSSTELLGMAIEEVVRTEEKYVDDLQTVFSVFEFLSATVDFGTLSDNPQTNADIQKCIAELKNMIDCHANFYAAIQAPQNATDESEQIAVSRLCSGFVAYADQFKSHYSSYCVLYPQVLAAWMPYESSPEAMAAVDQYKTTPSLYRTSTYAQRENKVMSLNIQSLLIKPVQRLCKYHLLLGQLMKYAQNGSQSATAIVKTTDLAADPDAVVDMAELKACLAVMKNVGDEVNAIKQRKDMDDLSSDLFANVNGWEGLAATKVGPLLYNDTVTIDAHKSGKKISNASIYVFQNAVVICAPNTQARRKESTADNIKENSGKNRASRKNSSVVSRKNSVDFFPAYNFTAAPPSIPPLEDHEFTQAPLQHKTHAPLTSRSIASIKTPKKSTSQTTKSAKNIISDGSHHNLTHISSTYNITTYSSVSTTSTPLSGSSRRGSRRASTDGRDQYQTNTASKVGGSPKTCMFAQDRSLSETAGGQDSYTVHMHMDRNHLQHARSEPGDLNVNTNVTQSPLLARIEGALNSPKPGHGIPYKRLKFIKMLIMSCVMIDEKNKLANASSDCLALISKRGDKTTSTTLVVCRSAENKVQLATHLHLAIDNWSKKNLQYSNDDILSLADMLSSAGENENRPLAMPDVNEYVMAIVNQDWSPGPGLTLPRAIDVNRGDTVHLYGGIPKDKTAFVGVKVFAHTLREGTVPAYILDLYDTGAKKGTMNVKHAPAIDLFSTTKSSRTSKKSLLSAMGDA